MSSMRKLLVALLAALGALLNRLRARWYRWRRLPTVRDQLWSGTLRPLALGAVRVPPAPVLADDRSPDYLSIPSSSRLLGGKPSPLFRVASTRILPAPARPLSALRADRWNVEQRRSMPEPVSKFLRPGETALRTPNLAALPRRASTVARPERFGLDANLSTRTERALPALEVSTALDTRGLGFGGVPFVPSPSTALPMGGSQRGIGLADPTAFGLDADIRPAAESVPAPRRLPPKLSPARANFVVRYVDPQRSEVLVKPIISTWGDHFEKSVEPYFGIPDLGADDDVYEWEVDDDVADQMKEVREQMFLRRDITRTEFDGNDLGRQERGDEEVLAAIETFTGLEFEDAEPEPWAPLKMRLETPPIDLAPPTESAERDLARLVAAIRDHPETA